MKRRGLLVPALMLVALLLVTCLAQLTRQPEQYRTARAAGARMQARALALAGLEDFLTKWRLDLHFPPRPPLGSTSFTYVEPIQDPSDGPVGVCAVTVDYRWETPPYSVLKVSSQGLLGDAKAPQARYQVDAVLDLHDGTRAGQPNRLGQWIQWREWTP